MTDRSKISELIERSSLGTAGARSLRGRTPPEIAQGILDRAAEHECTTTPMTTNATDSVADLLLRIEDGDPAALDEILRRSKRAAHRAEAPIDAVAVVSAGPEQDVLTLLQALFNVNQLRDNPYAEIARAHRNSGRQHGTDTRADPGTAATGA